MISRPRCALEADAFRQLSAGQGLADAVVRDIGDPTQTIEQAKHLQDGGVDADADIGVAGFDLLQGRAGGEGALGHDRHGQPPPTAGIVDIRTQLSQGALHSGGLVVWCRHLRSSYSQCGVYVA